MKFKICALIIFLSFGKTCFAHQDTVDVYESENITTFVTASYRFGVFEKSELFTQMAQKLSDDLSFRKHIILNILQYRNVDQSEYSIRVGHSQENRYNNRIKFIEDDKRALIITVRIKEFDNKDLLNIVEYAINNYKSIKSESKELEDYDKGSELPIEERLLETILNDTSKIVKSTLESKFEIDLSLLNLIWLDGKYSFKSGQIGAENEPIQLKVDDIYQIKNVGNYHFIFDTKSIFYALSDLKNKELSKKHNIPNTEWKNGIFKIEKIGSDLYAIFFDIEYPKEVYHKMLTDSGHKIKEQNSVWDSYAQTGVSFYKTQTMLYEFEKDLLIKDIRTLIDDK
ncbi:hypothetical protein [Algibacter lectus]|uniref:hypothetical protein n=1 Tax=Algibacter lectus TaxID=221126 RepID=UPI00249509BB|nr:hypothetical protein [Algibacter lectus]